MTPPPLGFAEEPGGAGGRGSRGGGGLPDPVGTSQKQTSFPGVLIAGLCCHVQKCCEQSTGR